MAIIDRNSILFEGPLTASATGAAQQPEHTRLGGKVEAVAPTEA